MNGRKSTESLMAQLLLLPDEVSLPRADKGLGMVAMPSGKDATL